MILEPNGEPTLTLRGEVVEILERGGDRVMALSVADRELVRVHGETLREVHLGDCIVIAARIRVERVREDGTPAPSLRDPP